MDGQQRIIAVDSSSNSSPIMFPKKNDVFISFLDEETCSHFTRCLFNALNRQSVKTYVDNQLKKGGEISPAFTEAIEDSHVSIVIFSRNYASSKWCLDELSKIMECRKFQGMMVVPVFYKVDPSHVTNQTGSYEQAFVKHEGEPRCGQWRANLTEAANLPGWDSRRYWIESVLIGKIVEAVLQKLPPPKELPPRYPKKHDVFLSFRGEDTSKKITSHLYKALKDEKVKAYYMDNQLEKGDEISPALTKAIEDSSVCVVIFSKNYASSRWYLGELSKILECKKVQEQIVIPVFHNIDPSHEGDPKGNKWRSDLTEAANLAGWDSTNRIETEFLKVILEDVLNKLAPMYPNQHKQPIGIEQAYKQIESLLEIGSSEVKTLGICGMGGIGKSTLARTLYDNMSCKFEGCCFLENVRERSNKLEDLCDELFSKLLKNKNHGFDNFEIIRLKRERVFIVLDDVASLGQLDRLINGYAFLGPGSRVIVTARDKQILAKLDKIYQVEELSSDHSLQLFCLNAFGKEQPEDGFEDLSSRVVSYCKGTPLSLKVLGASLYKKDEYVWKSELSKLGKIPDLAIYRVLRLSYDGLDPYEQDIFLDIACFFKGWRRDRLTSLLKACDFHPERGIDTLLDKSLITISDDNRIEMHDLIQEMGWEIVKDIKDPGERSRLWRHDEVLEVLEDNTVPRNVRGIIFDLCKLTRDLELSSISLASMTNVRHLMIHDSSGRSNGFKVCLPNGQSLLPNKLRYLQWDRFSLDSFPPTFCAKHLVELRMRDSKLKKLWDGVQDLVNLKTIDLSYSRNLIEIPDLSEADKLESVYLIDCESLCLLHVQSKSLCVVRLDGCSSLEKFSMISMKITELNLDNTAICALPSSIWCSTKLASLSLKGWKDLTCVENIGHLLSLEELDLSGTNIVEINPKIFEKLSMLKRLRLNDCDKLKSLPELPISLQEVSAVNCTSLDTEITQQLVLLHTLHNQCPCYFIFPGSHFIEACKFRTTASSITIDCLPKSNFCGLICCVILSKHGKGFRTIPISYSICQDDIQIVRDDKATACRSNLISDHVLFSYVDISRFGKISEVHDNFSVIFEFDHYDERIEFRHDQERIKGCGIFPVYAAERGFNKLIESPAELYEPELDALRREMKTVEFYEPQLEALQKLPLPQKLAPRYPEKHDVFLSFRFRGEDTDRNFISHLCKALKDENVKAYMDNQLEKGDEISPALTKAIEDSYVSVVIFSENGSSKWCLGELSKILECKKVQEQIVIPIFYNTDLSNVRNQNGSYEQAFAEYEGDPRCNKWRSDLTEAANLAGWDSTNRIESVLIEKVVEAVLQKLPPRQVVEAPLQKLPPRYPKKHDVFLSFRGEDTRLNFTSHLYKALNDEKVKVYIDYELEKGDEISPALTKAIEDSYISVVIFSENYAFSKWCLGELSKILECKKVQEQIVIPVFYNTDPSHVRKQTGSYKKAFAKHEGHPRCNKWRSDLTEAADLAGWPSTNRIETEFLKDIVEDVLKRLAPMYPNQRKRPIGIEQTYEQIESLLEIGSSEGKISLGIWGMGGIGKTTLARTLYDNLSCKFDGCCFLENVRERSNKLEDLYNKLLSQLLKYENHGFDNREIWRLKRKKVFVVLDDVATSEQLGKLIEYDFLGPGSRVIVTSRDKQKLAQLDKIYQVKKLSFDHSLQLFCRTAFGQKQPKDGYEDLSRSVVSYCEGIPLALKVLGASLYNKDESIWKSKLSKLGKIPNLEIHEVLRLSYDGLDSSEQDVFLDIASFFKGWHRDRVTSILEACDFHPESGIDALSDKSLITISNDNRIEMHDLMQEMGWKIVDKDIEDPGERSRLWRHDEVLEVLTDNTVTRAVKGIIFDLCKLTKDLDLSTISLANMKNARYLMIHDSSGRSNGFKVRLPDGQSLLPNKLRCLHWDRFCLDSLPPTFHGRHLVELRMRDSKLEKLGNMVRDLVNLKTIDLSYSRNLTQILDLSKADKLESVYLIDCKSLCQLHTQSTALCVVRLDGCSSLEGFLMTAEEITELNLANTAIGALPSSIWCSRKLASLSLKGRKDLTFVENIAHLSSLEELDLSGTDIVEINPKIFEELPMLKRLRLDDCEKLKSLLDLPKFLQEVSAVNCTSLDTEFTQQLVSVHMLHNQCPCHFIFPGSHLFEKCEFRATENSITINVLPKSNFRGLIYCFILSKHEKGFRTIPVSCSICQEGGDIQIVRDYKAIACGSNLISDHVLFSYVDIGDKISEVGDNFSVIFEFDHYDETIGFRHDQQIKKYALFPVYAGSNELIRSMAKFHGLK